MGKRIVYLIRHGQYSSTSAPGDEPDGALTVIGREQAGCVGERLAKLPIRIIYHSTLQRAIETAGIIAGHVRSARVESSDLLRECIPCVPPGLKDHYADVAAETLAHGEKQCTDAFRAFFAAPEKRGADTQEIIVAHGNLIGYFIAQVVGAPAEDWVRGCLSLGGLSEVHIQPDGKMKLVQHNDLTHLPPPLRIP